LRDTAVVTIPAAFGLFALAEPIARLLFEHGAAVDADAVAIGGTLQGFAVGLVFFSAFQLLTRSFYAMQDTKTPALVNICAGCVNIAAAVVYTSGPLELGLRGMALAHATSYLVGAAVLVVLLRRRLGTIDGGRIVRTALKAAIAAVGSAAGAVGALAIWETPADAGVVTQAVHVGVAIGVGVLVFLISALILRVGEVDDLRKALVRRFRG
jgi:putative peptidoglycan lipid II flippase